ncbi:hypothetical protein MHU86_212 [Fragilaria crotonensis]|nr:hypothetical protein MHU86_212 [Fragilaria crotonensis]
MLENAQSNLNKFLNEAMNDETKIGVSVRKSKVEPSFLSPRPGAKGGSGWGDFDSIVDEAERYFIDEDDANRFFSVFKWSPTSSRGVPECRSPTVKKAEKIRVAPDKKTANDESFYKERVRALSFDHDLPFDSTPLSPTTSVRRKARHNRSKGDDLPVDQEIDQPVVVRRRSKSISDVALVPDKFVPLEAHCRDSRTKDRSFHRRRHRSTSRDEHSADVGDLAATSASPTTSRERRRRHRRERSQDSDDGKVFHSATTSTSLSRSPHRSSHSRHNRHHRTSSREKEEEELIKLSSAVMLGKAPKDSLAAVTAERQRKLLERASKRDHRRHQSKSPVPGGEQN